MGLPGKTIYKWKSILSTNVYGCLFWRRKKNIWQDLAELWPKTEFQGCQIVLKIKKKNGLIGSPKVILWPQICWILCHQHWDGHVGALNLGLSQFKTGFWPCQILASLGSWGNLFCTKRLDSKMENNWATRTKKAPWFDAWKLAVGSWHSSYKPGGNSSNSPNVHMSTQKLWQMVGLILS